jgi:LPS export ABC transporter protein LptC
MVHFPDDDTALLDKPHIIQYKDNVAPRHSYSDSGWVAPGGNEVLLTGSVRVIVGHEQNDSGGIMTTESLKIKLKENDQ